MNSVKKRKVLRGVEPRLKEFVICSIAQSETFGLTVILQDLSDAFGAALKGYEAQRPRRLDDPVEFARASNTITAAMEHGASVPSKGVAPLDLTMQHSPSIAEGADMDPRSSSTLSNRSRLSLTEAFERIRAEEAEHSMRDGEEQKLRKERWEEGRKSLARALRRRMRDQAEFTPHEQEAESDLQAELQSSYSEAANVMQSTSPPYSPPHRLQQKAGSALDRPMGATQAAQPEHTIPSSATLDSTDAKDANQSVDARELRKMLHLVKDVLKQTSMERKDQVSLLSALHSDTDTFHLLDDPSQATTASKELADALSMEFRMEKISLEDAQYASRLDAIRKRLGALATEVMQEEPTPDQTKKHTAREPDVHPMHASSSPWPHYYTLVIRVAACLLVLVIVGFRFLRLYADYMATYTYYDPFYPFLFPAPSLMLAYLPADVYYNVPFTTTSKEAIAEFIAPLDAIWAE